MTFEQFCLECEKDLTHSKLLDLRDERVRINRELIPLRDLEWFEPERMTHAQCLRLQKLRRDLLAITEKERMLRMKKQ